MDTTPAPTTAPTDLVQAAVEARGRSYVPYSGFSMGAAVRVDDGSIVTGSLVENVSLGLAMCAERVAMFTAIAAGHHLRELALVSKRTAGELTWPCGACLQVALELGGDDVIVHAIDLDGVSGTMPIADLLPMGPATKASRGASDGSRSAR